MPKNAQKPRATGPPRTKKDKLMSYTNPMHHGTPRQQIDRQRKAQADKAKALLRKFTVVMDMHVGTDHETALCELEDKVRAFLKLDKRT